MIDPVESDAERFRRIDNHLRQLQKFLLLQRQSIQAALQIEVSADANSDLSDFEMEATIDILLAEDDPQYREDSDNILTTLDGLIDPCDSETSIEEQNFCDRPGHPMPDQGWLSHGAMEHGHGPDRPALDPERLLRSGKVWINVIVRRQYLLSLKTGQFEKML